MKPYDHLKPCPHCSGEGCDECEQTGYVEMSEQEVIEQRAAMAEAAYDAGRGH